MNIAFEAMLKSSQISFKIKQTIIFQNNIMQRGSLNIWVSKTLKIEAYKFSYW